MTMMMMMMTTMMMMMMIQVDFFHFDENLIEHFTILMSAHNDDMKTCSWITPLALNQTTHFFLGDSPMISQPSKTMSASERHSRAK